MSSTAPETAAPSAPESVGETVEQAPAARIEIKEKKKPKFPPYPEVPTPPAQSVADTIRAGRVLRAHDKTLRHDVPVYPFPKPARPKLPRVTDLKMTPREARAHALCLRRHGAVLTDRLEHMARPQRRAIIYLWREHADTLPPETIARLRAMLDADEPFKPDRAYEYFINMRKTKRATRKVRVDNIKRDLESMCASRRHEWARNAAVAFARGVQQRLRAPGRFALADGMLRLSNIILDELCGYMRMRTPGRQSRLPKAMFMMEMADKVAVWIDEILAESEDRMLMMDFDEDVEPPAPKPPPPPPPPPEQKPEPVVVPYTWVDAEGGKVPQNAVEGAQTKTGEPMYMVRAMHNGALTPGNLVPSKGCAYVSFDGEDYAKPQYQVLVGGQAKWQKATTSNFPANALTAGESETGEPLYLGRVTHEGNVIIGKVHKTHGKCYVPYEGKELGFKEFEVLLS